MADPYPGLFGPATTAFLETMFTMSPPNPCFLITSIPAFETINCPFTKMSYNLSHSSRVCSAIDFEILIPALFTTISTPPKARQASSNAFSVLFSFVTFNNVLETASFPNDLIKSFVASSSLSSLMSLITTQAPS
ncbi:hypothetical protein D3C87_1815140 [compost metagenome]